MLTKKREGGLEGRPGRGPGGSQRRTSPPSLSHRLTSLPAAPEPGVGRAFLSGQHLRRHLPKAQLSGPRGSRHLPRPGLSAGEMLASEPTQPDPGASAMGGSLSPSPGDRGRAVIHVPGRGGGGGPAVSTVWLQAAAGAAVQTRGAGEGPGWRPGHGLKRWGSGRAGTVPVRSFFHVLSTELGHAAGLGSEEGSAGLGSRGNGEAFQSLVVLALKTSQHETRPPFPARLPGG